jgi:hypothetical protein
MLAFVFARFVVLCSLVVWRIAHLLSRENGPGNLIVLLRATLGVGFLGRLMDNVYCLCFLLALPPAIWMSSSRMGFLIEWMTISTMACLLGWATQMPHRYLRVHPVSRSYLDKVIRGV